MSPRRATMGVFAVNGAAIGAWVAHIPWLQERFGLGNGSMGLLIAAMAVAVVIAFPIAGRAIVRRGSWRMTVAGGVACALALNLPLLGPTPVVAALGLLVLGAASATMDVSMNTHGVKVEHDLSRPIMSSLHAGWAFGGMAGAGLAAVGTALGVDPRLTVALISVLLLVLVVALARGLGAGSRAEGADMPGFALPSRSVVLLAVLCLLIMLTEGAMADWGGLYLRRDLGGSAALAAAAYSSFAAGMTLGRVFGDALNRRIGPVALLRWGAMLTAVPLAVMLAIGRPVPAFVALFVIGLGVANGVPLMFSAAGRRSDTPTGPAIAAVSSMGSVGFLAGPPLIGGLAEVVSLPWALTSLILGALLVFGLARRATGAPSASARALPDRAPADVSMAP